MKLAHILLALLLLVPLAFSAPANDGDVNYSGEAIDIAHPAQDHAQETVTKAAVFVGSIKSDKYHYPSCRAAKNIKEENKIWFSNSEDARAQGYSPCGICHPP
ncbi:MAG: Ada metal-binding domain-containing protein [Methanothrix sp.]